MKQIAKIVKANPIIMGDIEMKQPLPANGIEHLDPFLLIQHGAGIIEPNTNHRKV